MRATLGAGGLVALALVGCLCGCATHEPAPAPLLDLSALHCEAAPSLAGAPVLAYDPKKHEGTTTALITASSPCVRGAAGASLYAAYGLPSLSTPYLVRVNSDPEGATLLALRVLLYGPDGSLKREFSGKRILFRGNALSVLFRNHDNERYLVVASDPAAVGSNVSRVHDATQSGVIAVYPGYVSYFTGTDVTIRNVLSHNGRVVISLRPLPVK